MDLLLTFISQACLALPPSYISAVPSEIQAGARKWSLVFSGVGFAAFLAALLQYYSFNFMGQRLGTRVRVRMMRALLRQEVGWYDDERNSSGVLTSKLSADALAVKGQLGDAMGLITQVSSRNTHLPAVIFLSFREHAHFTLYHCVFSILCRTR